MKHQLLDTWKDIRLAVAILAGVIVFGFSLPYLGAPAYGVDRPDGSIVVNAEDALVPGDWGLIDDLAFSLYSEQMTSGTANVAYMNHSLIEAYKRANYFLKHMEATRKPYIEEANRDKPNVR